MNKRLFVFILAILILLGVVWVFATEHVYISAITPANNSYIKSGQNITCAAISSGSSTMENMTIFIGNTKQINQSTIANNTAETFNISDNSSLSDGVYQFYCFVALNNSNSTTGITNSTNSTGNYTITLDKTAPNGYSISVTDGAKILSDTNAGELNQTARMSYLNNASDINVTITITELYPREVRLYYTNNGSFPNLINGSNYTKMLNQSTATPWTFEGYIPKSNLSDGAVIRFSIWINDSAGNTQTLDNGGANAYNFTIDGTAPISKTTMPAVIVISAQRSMKIKCIGTDAGSGVQEIHAVIKDPSGTLHTQKYIGTYSPQEFEFRGLDTGRAGEYKAWCESKDIVGHTTISGRETFRVLSSIGKGRAEPVKEVAPEEEIEEEEPAKEKEEGAAILPEVAGKAGLWITLIVVLAIIIIIYFVVKKKKR